MKGQKYPREGGEETGGGLGAMVSVRLCVCGDRQGTFNPSRFTLDLGFCRSRE